MLNWLLGKSRQEEVNEQIYDTCASITTSAVSRCVSSANLKAELDIDNYNNAVAKFGEITIKQAGSVNTDMLLQSENVDKINKKLASEIQQLMDRESKGVLARPGDQDVYNFILSRFRANITHNEFVDEMTSISETALMTVKNHDGAKLVIGRLTFDQTFKVATKAYLNASNATNIIDTISTDIAQSEKSKSEGPLASFLDSFANMVKSWAFVFAIIVIATVVVLLVLLYYLFKAPIEGTGAEALIKEAPQMAELAAM